MSIKQVFKKALSSARVGVGLGIVSSGAFFAQEAQAQETNKVPAITDKLHDIFNNSEVTSTGWSLPLASLNASGTTTFRAEVGYADATPGVYVRHTYADGGKLDAGFMNFSQNVFPLGDTLNFNSKGDLYSNGEQTGDQLGLRYSRTMTLSDISSLDYAGFAGWSVQGGAPSVGVNADYHRKLGGQWNLLAGAGVSWLGERDGAAFNAIAAVDRHFTYQNFPDGKLTMGVLLKEEATRDAHSRATLFTEYQTHIAQDGPQWLHHISGLFGAYAGTQSYGGKVGVLYSPGKFGDKGKDFGVSFGPSVGWDSKERGPQINFELRSGF